MVMECHNINTSRQIFWASYCVDKPISLSSCWTKNSNLESFFKLQGSIAGWSSRLVSQRLTYSNQASIGKNCADHISRRTFCAPVNLEEEFSSVWSQSYSEDGEDAPEASEEEVSAKPLSSEELKAVAVDSERAKLIKKLSEANQQNRFLKRQLYVKEDALVNFKSELATMELEIQALVSLAEEISKSGIPEGSRKINGKYIQSHLLSRLASVQEKLKEQIKDVDAARSKEVQLFWCGMAESVQVMGSFDGWSLGEHLSADYTGYYTKFSTAIMLRPGRYQIKFLVDGEWRLSPELPTIGEGLMKNNLLIVE
ncbi:unnamed protein product [Ilex paraguariensis]|uniref:AMP-activated protein kinase glycogen-binding domain-containing protein n=1 Tax=Ilex paraguariensis TaxID=185542 RepID=A0ABC8TAV9_9AQUA